MDYKKYSEELEKIIEAITMPDHTRITVEAFVKQAREKAEGGQDAGSHPQWIPVAEELPKENQRVLTYNGVYNEIYVCDYENGMFEDVYGVFHDGVITHWMPLPKAPRKEE